MKILLPLLFFLGTFCAQAASDLCEDIKPLVCSGKSRDDGTGKNPTLEEIQGQIFKDINALTDANIAKFSDLLENPEKSGWRKLAFTTIPIERKKCPRPEDLQKNPCRKIFAEVLAKLVDDEHLAAHSVSEESLALRVNFEEKTNRIQDLTGTLEYETISEDHYQALRKLNRNPEQEKKIQSDLFPKVKERLLQKVESLDVDDQTKKQMTQKIREFEFGGFDCEKGARSDLAYIQAQYKTKSDVECDFRKTPSCRVRICRGTSSLVKSEFSLIFILAHELSHAIDPCLFSRGSKKTESSSPKTVAELDSQYPLKNVLSCLRSPQSVRAQNKMEFCRNLKKDQFSDEDCANSMAVAQNCNDELSKNDQIGEAVSDLFATEVTYELVRERHPELSAEQWRNGISNLFPTSQNCEKPEHRFDEHPDQIQRFNKLVLAHPQIREAMGCPKKSAQKNYCGGEVSKTGPRDSGPAVKPETPESQR